MVTGAEATGKYPVYYDYVRQWRPTEEMLAAVRHAAEMIPETEREAVIRDATVEIQSQNIHSLKQFCATRFVQVMEQSITDQRWRTIEACFESGREVPRGRMRLPFREFIISRRAEERINKLVSLRYPGVDRITFVQLDAICGEVDTEVRREREKEQFDDILEDTRWFNRPFIYGLDGMVWAAEKVDKLQSFVVQKSHDLKILASRKFTWISEKIQANKGKVTLIALLVLGGALGGGSFFLLRDGSEVERFAEGNSPDDVFPQS